MQSERVKPELSSGLKDYLPDEMIPRQQMIDSIRNTMELFGFLPLSTPVLEKMEVLTGGDADFKKQIFKVEGSDKLALRFDLTVPLARVVASNTVSRPFKRYQYGPVFRGESAQFGRYREFMQFDADIVGSDNVMADAEIIALTYQILKSLNIENFKIKINDRRILNKFFIDNGIEEKNFPEMLRVLDKLEKIGDKETIKEWTEITGEKKAKEIFDKLQNISNESLDELFENIINLGVPKNKLVFDRTIARGLGYYTGIVFETVLSDLPEIGSVASGGRYDALVERFSNEKVPAVGASIGVDRLFAALEKLGKLKKKPVMADVLVLNLNPSCEELIQKTASSLREAGIKTEIYLGKETTFKGQLAYAVNREYPIVVIIGPKELEKGVAQIKNMKDRDQKEATLDSIVAEVKKIINAKDN